MNHPIEVAERIATLDILSKGRLHFGVGKGRTQQEAGPPAVLSSAEAFPRLVPGSDFKSDERRGDASLAGSIPVRFRRLSLDEADLHPVQVE